MNLLKLFTLSVCSLILVACSSIPTQTQSTIPSALREPCLPLAHLPQSQPGKSTMGDLLQHDKDLMTQYADCAQRQKALSEIGAVAPAPPEKPWYHFGK